MLFSTRLMNLLVVMTLYWSRRCLLALGQNASYTGPGYVACPAADYNVQKCESGLDDSCSLEILATCGSTITTGNPFLPTFDGETVYIPLLCGCAKASNCPSTCTFSDDAPPTRPPFGTTNFTGAGTLTCVTADYLTRPCVPNIENLTACVTCDADVVPEEPPEFMLGDEFVTLVIPCDCFVLNDCPDTCTFSPGLNVTNPTPTTTTGSTAPPTSPVATTPSPTATPNAVGTPTAPTNTTLNESTTTTVAPSLAPVDRPTAPIRAPTSMVTVPTPNNNNSTSSSSSYSGRCASWGVLLLVVLLSCMVSL